VSPATPGAHSAILRLDDPATTGIDHQVMNTVVAAYQFNLANKFTVTASGSTDRATTSSFFYNVPANAPALKVDLTGITGLVRFFRYDPYGMSVDDPDDPSRPVPDTLSNPLAGVWEVVVEVGRRSAVSPGTYSITASILGVDVTPSSLTVNPAALTTPYTQTFTFRNRLATYSGNEVGTTLGSAIKRTPTIANHEQQVVTVDVPAGSTQLFAKIGSPADTAADLDLFVYPPDGTPARSSADGESEEQVTVANPVAGIWKVLIDGSAVPSGSTSYSYLDLVSNPVFGAITAPNVIATHATGDEWSRDASATAATSAGAGRFHQGFVQAKRGSIVVGQAEVNLVTP